MNFSIVTAVTPDYKQKLEWCLPTWTMKPQFRDCKLYVFHHGFKDADKELNWILDYFSNMELINWNMESYDNIRELMLSAFVLGTAEFVQEDHFCKLDADTYFVNDQDVFEPEHFKLDLYSHSWGYTKPAWWLDKMESFVSVSHKEWNGDTSNINRFNHKRIQSVCCLHKTEFVRIAANLSNAIDSRLPIPSHDTYLWYLADYMDDRSWGSSKLYRNGVEHSSRFKSIRESICSKVNIWNRKLNTELMSHIQIHVTDACNIGCNNCDRCCGIAKTTDRMSVEQIEKFVIGSEDREYKRIDIIGGEPLLHPELNEIIYILEYYKKYHPQCKFRLTTNGTINKEGINDLPEWISVRNSFKSSDKKEYDFESFNIAPVDLGFSGTNALSCSIPWRCGPALSKYGFFFCGAGYGVARTFGLDIGILDMKDYTPENLYNQRRILCQYCGHSRSIVKLKGDMKISKTWESILDRYKNHKPYLTEYK